MEKKVNSYAEALFLLSREEESSREYLTALCDICTVFRENPEYPVFLASYAISKEKRIEAIEKAFGGRIPERVVSFICILCEKRKIFEIEEIKSEFENMYFQAENISKAVVTGAYPLSDDQKAKMKEKLERLCGHRVEAQFETDRSLIGGMTVELDGRIIDSSVRNQLNKLREVMDK